MSTQNVPIIQAPPHTPDASFFDVQRSDAGNARRLLEAHGRDICYHAERNEWLVWDGKRWISDSKGRHVAGKMKTVLQELRNESVAIVKELTPSVGAFGETVTGEEEVLKARLEKAKKDHKWSIDSESDRHVSGAVRQAASEAAVKIVHDWELDANLLLLNVQNGTYDLEANCLREHRREDFITKLAPVTYDPVATCERFDRFMSEIFPGNQLLIDYVQRVTGYCLSGLTTERIVLFLIGAGLNGKSVLCNVMLRGIFGEHDGYGMDSSFSTFTTSKYSAPDKPRNDLIRMRGKRFVAASEADDSSMKIDTALLKKISGNDDLSVRGNFQQEIEYTPQAKVFLRMNNEPRILDGTDSTWDRVKKITFKRQFSEDEKDPELTEKLLKESSGIFNWLLGGWRLVQTAWSNHEAALPEPVEVKMATAEYRQTQSQVARFFMETYQVTSRECKPVPISEIYEAYKGWAAKQGEFPKNQTAFGLELARLFEKYTNEGYKNVAKKRYGHGNVWCWFGIERFNGSLPASSPENDPQAEIPF
jgi:putative DNA primase/helicase